MEVDDPLGDEGRKWINSCVKVEIFKKPTQKEYTEFTDFDTNTIPIDTVDGQGGANYETTMAGMPLRVESKDQPEINSPVEGPGHKRAGKTPTQQSDVPLGLDQEKYRAAIYKEREEAKEHGTGFIISDHLLITSHHVISDTLPPCNKETLEIRISNEVINELPCKVIDWDISNDLALLHCKDLNLKETNILPLPLCAKVPLQSQGVFIFGYPFTYFGKSALFFKGYVSGRAERYGRPTFMVLYCSVCPGNSGGPVFRWMQGQLNVVAVLAQRHKKDILAIDERNIIEDTRRSLEQSSLKNYSERSDACSVALKTVTIQLCDAVEETHCQFGLCNAVPGNLVTEFIENTRRKPENTYYRNELNKVVVRPVNIACRNRTTTGSPDKTAVVSYMGSTTSTEGQVLSRAATTSSIGGSQENAPALVRSKTIGGLPSMSSVVFAKGAAGTALGRKDDGLPIAVAFIESVNAFFRGSDQSKCMVKVTGDITVSFPASVLPLIYDTENAPMLSFLIRGTSCLEQILPNKALISSKGQLSGGDGVSYDFNMASLAEHLKKQSEQGSSTYYNIDIIKYEVKTNGFSTTPLQLCSYWKCEEEITDLRVDYRYNPTCMSAPCSINNLSILVPVNGGVTIMHSKPSATWSSEHQRALWKLQEVSNTSENKGSLRARFDLTQGPSTPSRIAVQFMCNGATISRLNFEVKSQEYKLSFVKKKVSSGKYIAES